MKLQDVHWILPLLQAVEKGKTLQYAVSGGEWVDVHPQSFISFISSSDGYRIKPDSIRFRNYLWHSRGDGRKPRVLTVTEEDNKTEPREKWKGFIRWLGDWQEVEVGQLNG